MRCTKCKTLMPSYYNKCPVCGYGKLEAERFAPQPTEEVEVEPISAEVVTSVFEIGELDE